MQIREGKSTQISSVYVGKCGKKTPTKFIVPVGAPLACYGAGKKLLACDFDAFVQSTIDRKDREKNNVKNRLRFCGVRNNAAAPQGDPLINVAIRGIAEMESSGDSEVCAKPNFRVFMVRKPNKLRARDSRGGLYPVLFDLSFVHPNSKDAKREVDHLQAQVENVIFERFIKDFKIENMFDERWKSMQGYRRDLLALAKNQPSAIWKETFGPNRGRAYTKYMYAYFYEAEPYSGGKELYRQQLVSAGVDENTSKTLAELVTNKDKPMPRFIADALLSGQKNGHLKLDGTVLQPIKEALDLFHSQSKPGFDWANGLLDTSQFVGTVQHRSAPDHPFHIKF